MFFSGERRGEIALIASRQFERPDNILPGCAFLARKLFTATVNMKMPANSELTRPDLLRFIPSPLVHLFPDKNATHHDPPAVRAAWLRLYCEIIRKPKRASHKKH